MYNLGNLGQQPQSADNQTNLPTQPLNQSNFEQTSKGLFQVPEKFLQLIPLLLFALEMLTGQKVPATGVLADILSLTQQNQASLQQLQANQRQLWNKLESLENNASNQLTNLTQQVNNFKVLATETRKSLEFQGNKFDKTPQFNQVNEPESEYN